MNVKGRKVFYLNFDCDQGELYSLWRALGGFKTPETDIFRRQIEGMIHKDTLDAWKGYPPG